MNHQFLSRSLVLSFCLIALPAVAHPGRTASDGCHFCKTNCAKWGVPQGQRHCHYAPESGPDDLLSSGSPGDVDLTSAVAVSIPVATPKVAD